MIQLADLFPTDVTLATEVDDEAGDLLPQLASRRNVQQSAAPVSAARVCIDLSLIHI